MMLHPSIQAIRKIREAIPGIGLLDAKNVFQETRSVVAAIKHIKDNIEKYVPPKKQKVGKVFSYVHPDYSFGVLVSLTCESESVANSSLFTELGNDLCLQLSQPIDPTDHFKLFEDLPWLKNKKLKVKTVLNNASKKLGEKISFNGGQRLSLNDD